MKCSLRGLVMKHVVFFWYIKSIAAVKQTPAAEISHSVHQCIHYTNKISKLLDEQGKQCLQCDPTHPVCDPVCQNAVDYQYVACLGVCLPDGFYFNPGQTLDAQFTLSYAYNYCILHIIFSYDMARVLGRCISGLVHRCRTMWMQFSPFISSRISICYFTVNHCYTAPNILLLIIISYGIISY